MDTLDESLQFSANISKCLPHLFIISTDNVFIPSKP